MSFSRNWSFSMKNKCRFHQHTIMLLLLLIMPSAVWSQRINTNVKSLATDKPKEVFTGEDLNFSFRVNLCSKKTSNWDDTCKKLNSQLAGLKFDETVEFPSSWGDSMTARRKTAEEIFKMKFTPSFGYRVKSCFGFCADEEKKQDTLSITDGSRGHKETEGASDTKGGSDRRFFNGVNSAISTGVSK